MRDKVYVIIEVYDYVDTLEDNIFFNTYEEAEEYVNNTGGELYVQELKEVFG